MNVGEFHLDASHAMDSTQATHLELTATELPFQGTVVRSFIREALVPFIVWEAVPVRTLEPRQLGRMEVFLLEASLELENFYLIELHHATGVPAMVIAASAHRLLSYGALIEVQPEAYVVDKEQARLLLTRKNLEEEHSRIMTIAYFPRQDIVIANPEIAGQLLTVHKKLRARYQAPYRTDVDRPENLADFIAGRITEGRVFGHPHSLLGLDPWPKPPPWPKLAPCYHVRGQVIGEGDGAVADLQFWGSPRRRLRGFEGESVRLMGDLPLIREWVSLTDDFKTMVQEPMQGLPELANAHLEKLAPCHYRMRLMHEDARSIAADRRLTDPLSISICSPTAKADIRLSFEPADGQAAALFVLDSIAQQIDEQRHSFSEKEFAQHVQMARQRYPDASHVGITRAQVENRLWQLKRFLAVYQHRAIEDFAYG